MLEQQLEQDDESQCCRNTKIHPRIKKKRRHLHHHDNTFTTQELPTTLDLNLLTLQCIVTPTGTEKQARKKKSVKRKNQSCAKRDLEFRDLSCTL
jgi:hypothetical protein